MNNYNDIINALGTKLVQHNFKDINLSLFDINKPLNIYIATWVNQNTYIYKNDKLPNDFGYGLVFEQDGETVYYDTRLIISNFDFLHAYLPSALALIYTLEYISYLKFNVVNIYNDKITKLNYKTVNFNENVLIYKFFKKAILNCKNLTLKISKPKTEEELDCFSTAKEVANFDEIVANEHRKHKHHR